MSAFTSHRVGAYYTAENSVLFRHKSRRTTDTHRGAVFLTGHTSIATQAFYSGIYKCLYALADRGVDVLAIDGGGTSTWGNDTMVGVVDTVCWSGYATPYMVNQLGCTGPFLIGGYSMGGVDAQNWAARRLSDTAGFFGFAPVCDLDAMQANVTFTSAINTAYDNNYATNSVNHDPIDDFVDELSIKPWRAWYSTADTVIPSSHITAMASAVGGTATQVTGDHTTMLDNIDPTQFADWAEDILS